VDDWRDAAPRRPAMVIVQNMCELRNGELDNHRAA
jgi:hypothetical protein